MSNTDKAVLERSLDYAEKAMTRLEEVLASPSFPEMPTMKRDATIQRFEFTYEMTWKLFRKVLQSQGVPAAKVRTAFNVIAEAGAAGWLKNRELWEQMIADRNYTSHEYEEKSAKAVFERIEAMHAAELRQAINHVRESFFKSHPLNHWKDREDA